MTLSRGRGLLVLVRGARMRRRVGAFAAVGATLSLAVGGIGVLSAVSWTRTPHHDSSPDRCHG